MSYYLGYCFDTASQTSSGLSSGDGSGLFSTVRTDSVTLGVYQNSTLIGASITANAGAVPAYNIFLGARSNQGSPVDYFNRTMKFAYVGAGFTASEIQTISNACLVYQNALGRA